MLLFFSTTTLCSLSCNTIPYTQTAVYFSVHVEAGGGPTPLRSRSTEQHPVFCLPWQCSKTALNKVLFPRLTFIVTIYIFFSFSYTADNSPWMDELCKPDLSLSPPPAPSPSLHHVRNLEQLDVIVSDWNC